MYVDCLNWRDAREGKPGLYCDICDHWIKDDINPSNEPVKHHMTGKSHREQVGRLISVVDFEYENLPMYFPYNPQMPAPTTYWYFYLIDVSIFLHRVPRKNQGGVEWHTQLVRRKATTTEHKLKKGPRIPAPFIEFVYGS